MKEPNNQMNEIESTEKTENINQKSNSSGINLNIEDNVIYFN